MCQKQKNGLKMNKRILGISGIDVSPIGLGCMGMTHAYGPARDRNAMVELIQRAVELGCNFFDTAVVYGAENEEFLGHAVKDIRDEVVIATKFGIVGQSKNSNAPVNQLDSRPETIKQQLNESLERLQTDYIDMYYQHRVDPNVDAETVANLMADFIDEGIIKAWGLSNAPVEYLKKAHEICPISAIENQYSMVFRQSENLFGLCEELNIAFVAYSPLGNGFLTGKYDNTNDYEDGDFRKTMKRFSKESVDNNKELLDLISSIAQDKQCTNAQIVLAWELAQKPFIIPIPGSTKMHRLEENLKSWNIELSKQELSEINEKLSKLEIDESFF